MKKLELTICGCGNGAHACAVILGSKGHAVNIYSPLKNEIDLLRQSYSDNKLTAILPNNQEKTATLNKVTYDASEVIPDASIIFIIVPSFAHANILRNIEPYISAASIIVTIPARSGFEYEARKIISKGNIICLQTLPWACRIIEFGKLIEIKGSKIKIQAATISSKLPNTIIFQLERLLEVKIVMLKNMLTLTLGNIGQIIHPGIMYGLLKENPNVKFHKDNIPLFYQSVDDNIAKILANVSKEIQNIARNINNKLNGLVNAEEILTIDQWLENSYGSLIKDNSSLSKMFRTNLAYQGLTLPVKKYNENMYISDLDTRYITEDVPYGLLITKSIAEMLNVSTPQIDEILFSLGKWTGHNYIYDLKATKDMASKSRVPEVFGINTLDDILAVYGQ
ncbi:NAD/NADP-dependent octopine/nopaline dehydrogenase family protein [Lutispora sp.]|uniref:NAD/NADP-dependent octopine/nopaline dehydrogenase family protein n=1 Tax=Lutispora sp. TaxID=2828727 RepID=UPI002B1EBBB4|nr:NAD/NADP octopine/nopaline dehydrogenase family protein [Lutispora sp.]MEA4961604.1 NAD/NADP octopine/nopaline dehydrogenase family protein [Lutispora sp.]